MTLSKHSCNFVVSAMIVVAAILSQAVGAGARQETGSPERCNEQLGFADQLAKEGDFFRAIGEYKRFLYVCPDDRRRSTALYAIGRCYFLAGRYGDVLEWYRHASTDSAATDETALLAGHALFRLAAYDKAYTQLETVVRRGRLRQGIDQASYLAALSLVRIGRGKEAVPLLMSVVEPSPYSQRAREYADRLRDIPRWPKKNPLLAGTLAVVPGAGYAYAGHYGTALASVAVIGLLSWTTLEAFDDGHEAAGATCSIFAFGFYFGSIVGSAESARRFTAFQAESYQSRFPE